LQKEVLSAGFYGSLKAECYSWFDWYDAVFAVGVRSYIKESIMSLLEVHAEVYNNNNNNNKADLYMAPKSRSH